MIKNNYNRPGEYDYYVVEHDGKLLDWLLENVKGMSKSKIKSTLQGRGIKVGQKVITQFDYP
ncbi:MAG: RNA pseudouridine synthase, partial [Prevotella sp.]|nr:RNA pseudouridine synthase [Prevotella sp.]